MSPDTQVIYLCRWPGGCPADAAIMIGTTSMRPFHCCYSHAKAWRAMSYAEMADTHARLEPHQGRRASPDAGPLETRNHVGIRDRNVGGNIWG